MRTTLKRRARDQLLPSNAMAAVTARGRAAARLRGGGRRRPRRRVEVVLRRAAGLVAVLVAATTAGSITRQAPAAPISIYATLGAGAGRPLLEIDGTQDPRKSDRFAITGSLRGLPCPGRTYRLVIAATVGAARPFYDATFVLRRSRGQRIRCAVPLPRTLGRTFVRIQIYRKGATPGDSSVIVKGRRLNAIAIKGSLTTRRFVCRDAHRLRAQFSSPSRRVSLLYEMRFKKVSIGGRPCS